MENSNPKDEMFLAIYLILGTIVSIIGFWLVYHFYPTWNIPALIPRICVSFCSTILLVTIGFIVMLAIAVKKDENNNILNDTSKGIKIYGSK